MATEQTEIQETTTVETKKGIVNKVKETSKNLIGSVVGAVRKNWKPFALGAGATLAAGLAAGLFGTKVDGADYETPPTDFDSDSPSETIDVPFEEVTIE